MKSKPTDTPLCDHKVWCDEKGTVRKADTVKSIGGCMEGCCDDFQCSLCGKTWRVEWPD